RPSTSTAAVGRIARKPLILNAGRNQIFPGDPENRRIRGINYFPCAASYCDFADCRLWVAPMSFF
ncbi:hypothetical protein, partial [Rhizobium sp. PEPV16]|uniref:hypothetical protein n=1 Tax=Rhizobium sp. PEPV16 TaxID=1820614 RepID=UPI001AEFC1BB